MKNPKTDHYFNVKKNCWYANEAILTRLCLSLCFNKQFPKHMQENLT